MISVDYSKCCWKDGKCAGCSCAECKGCVQACPVGAISREEKVEIDLDRCTECGACADACKYGAISMS